MKKQNKFDYGKTYYKVFNAEENHNGLQYKDGLVVDRIPFNDDPEESCVPGGIYFTDLNYIGDFFLWGDHCREITIPPDAKVVKDPTGDKWRADKVICGKSLTFLEVCTLLPENYEWSIDLSSLTSAEGLTLPQTVRGYIDLSSLTSAEGLTLPQTVGGSIHLSSLTSAEGLDLSKYKFYAPKLNAPKLKM